MIGRWVGHCEHCKQNLQFCRLERLIGSIIELEPQNIESQSRNRSQDLANSAAIILRWDDGMVKGELHPALLEV